MRKTFFAVLGVSLCLIGVVLGARGQSSAATPTQAPATSAARLWPGIGVGVALERYDAAGRAAALDAIRAAGLTWVRQRFPWDQIEPAPGQYNWAPWDEIVEAAAERNLTLVAVLDGAPLWARAQVDADNPLAPPSHPADFGRFARAFAERYGDRIRFYQVWDEPNIRPHWGARAVDAGGYTRLLREAAIQLRSVDSDAVILLAALAPTVEGGGDNLSDLAFLSDLYSAGAATWFDAAAGQPYGFEQSPSAPPEADTLNFRRAELLRQVMEQHGDAATPLWLVVYGWHAAPTGQPAAAASPWGSVDEQTQAQWAVEAADWARRHWPWTAGLAWAWWQPPQPPENPRWGFALVTVDGAPRPALAALARWTQQPHPLGPGAWSPSAPGLDYAGGWRVTPSAADPPPAAAAGNNRLVVPFEGDGLALRVARGPYWAYLDVSVDGQPANALPRDRNGRAYLVLYDPLAAEALVTVAEGLSNGPHIAEITATGGWDQWPLREIVVLSGAAAARPPWQRWLPWLLALAGAGLLLASSSRLAAAALNTGRGIAASLLRVLAPVQSRAVWVRYALLAALIVAAVLLPGALRMVALTALFVWLVIFPGLGLPLLGLVAPLFLVDVPVLGRSLSPAEVVIGLSAGALAVHSFLRLLAAPPTTHRARFIPHPLDWPVLFLLGVSLASTAAADHFGVALRELRTVLLEGVVAYGLVRLVPGDRGDGRLDPWPLVGGLGAGAVIVALWGISQAASGVGVITAEGVLRVRGPYGSPNNLALYLGHLLPVALALVAFAADRGKRLVAGVWAVPVFLALVLTFSKGALLLGLPAAVLFLGFAAGGRWRWVALALLAVGAVALLPLFGTERFSGLFDMQRGTSFFRLQLWQGAWNMIRDHPWLGVGPDNFLYAYRTRYVLPTAWQEINLSHPHNLVLDFWSRLGIFGLAAGVWLFVAAFVAGWRALRRAVGDERALLLGLLASLVATLAHGLIDNSVFLVDLMLLFMLTLGLIARLAERSSVELTGARRNSEELRGTQRSSEALAES